MHPSDGLWAMSMNKAIMILHKLCDACVFRYQKREETFARFQMTTSPDLDMAHLNSHSLSFRDSLDSHRFLFIFQFSVLKSL